MADCCGKKPAVTDIARSERLSRRATREATRAANAQGSQARAVLVKPHIKKPNVKPVKPCCGKKVKAVKIPKR